MPKGVKDKMERVIMVSIISRIFHATAALKDK